jgi:hypothetical protein
MHIFLLPRRCLFSWRVNKKPRRIVNTGETQTIPEFADFADDVRRRPNSGGVASFGGVSFV